LHWQSYCLMARQGTGRVPTPHRWRKRKSRSWKTAIGFQTAAAEETALMTQTLQRIIPHGFKPVDDLMVRCRIGMPSGLNSRASQQPGWKPKKNYRRAVKTWQDPIDAFYAPAKETTGTKFFLSSMETQGWKSFPLLYCMACQGAAPIISGRLWSLFRWINLYAFDKLRLTFRIYNSAIHTYIMLFQT